MTRQMLSDAEWTVPKGKLQSIGRIWKHAQEARNWIVTVEEAAAEDLGILNAAEALGKARLDTSVS